MKHFFVALMFFPAVSFALSLPIPSIPGVDSGTSKFFGGLVADTGRCLCREEPQKFGWMWIDYDIFWDGSTKTEKSLMHKPLSTKFYDYEKKDENVWHLGKYESGNTSCKYMTVADIATAIATYGVNMPCSGSYNADGTIIFAGTSKGGGGLISILPGL